MAYEEYSSEIYGDALWETSGWYFDDCSFPTSSFPFFGRGGRYDGSNGRAGSFAFEDFNGGYGGHSFRTVLVAL